MRVAIFGLGYVGSVTAASLAALGHTVVGVDVSAPKVRAVNQGESPILEPGLSELTATQVAAGRLSATEDGAAAIRASDVSMVTVGTPSELNGDMSIEALVRVVRDVASEARRLKRRHTVVIRSTILPGTTERILLPLIEAEVGEEIDSRIGLAVNPEFLREGTAIADFRNPSRTVIGELNRPSGDVVESLYRGLAAPCFRLPLKAAEMTKYIDNAFHAVKVTFANEIGAICRSYGLDSHEVMRCFLADEKLNISPAYLSPGFAFGGSCLPKDMRALLYASRRNDVGVPMLEAVLASNLLSVDRALNDIVSLGRRRIGLFGLAFKSGTDDLRESPYVELAERLLGKGFDIMIYDPAVSVAGLTGSNRRYVDQRLPHLVNLMSDSVSEVTDHAEVCVVGMKDEAVVRALNDASGRFVVDLVRLPDATVRRQDGGYIGVAW